MDGIVAAAIGIVFEQIAEGCRSVAKVVVTEGSQAGIDADILRKRGLYWLQMYSDLASRDCSDLNLSRTSPLAASQRSFQGPERVWSDAYCWWWDQRKPHHHHCQSLIACVG